MAIYLEGKSSVDTNELSPKEATQMSQDVKYIGMDVHKEAVWAGGWGEAAAPRPWRSISRLRSVPVPLAMPVSLPTGASCTALPGTEATTNCIWLAPMTMARATSD